MPAANSQFDRLRRGFSHVQARIEQFISGRPQEDPLYLSNRTWKQKLKVAAITSAAVVFLAVLVTAAATDAFRLRKVDPFEHPAAETPASTAHRPTQDLTLTPAELDVVNIRIARDGRTPMVTGVVRNNTNQAVASAKVSYYLADNAGRLIGSDTIDVANLPPHGSVSFRVVLKAMTADYAIVREVHPN